MKKYSALLIENSILLDKNFAVKDQGIWIKSTEVFTIQLIQEKKRLLKYLIYPRLFLKSTNCIQTIRYVLQTKSNSKQTCDIVAFN